VRLRARRFYFSLRRRLVQRNLADEERRGDGVNSRSGGRAGC
jgi:hypothetical protein